MDFSNDISASKDLIKTSKVVANDILLDGDIERINRTIARNLVFLRKKINLTQKKVADCISNSYPNHSVSESTIKKYEDKACSSSRSLDVLIVLAKFYNVPLIQLLTDGHEINTFNILRQQQQIERELSALQAAVSQHALKISDIQNEICKELNIEHNNAEKSN